MFSFARYPRMLRTVHVEAAPHHSMQGTVKSIAQPRMIQRRRPSCVLLRPTLEAYQELTPELRNATSEDPLHVQRVAWAQARQSRIRIDPVLWMQPPKASDTTLAAPWKTVTVMLATLRELCGPNYPNWCPPAYPYLSPLVGCWGIGAGRKAANCNPVDINELALDGHIESRAPGQGPFAHVVRGPYGERYCKYLYVIDHAGMHIVREMTPCDLSSRGIALHSLMREEAIVGGEIFFDMDDPGKVIINFGSARFPVASNQQAEKIAQFVLSIGYKTVVAMIPQREFRAGEYSLGDRYGKDVPNVEFRMAPQASSGVEQEGEKIRRIANIDTGNPWSANQDRLDLASDGHQFRIL